MIRIRPCQTILITGGSGFIGSNLIRFLFQQTDFTGRVINIDKLTYAGNPINLQDVAGAFSGRYRFIHGDIRDQALLSAVFAEEAVDTVCHLAAESHVDRSIDGPGVFIQTNIIGTHTLLETALQAWTGNMTQKIFHHVSTDEVYGSLGKTGRFTERTAYDPRSPYSASKASSDHLVRSYYHTYGLPVTVSNCSNNYGPYQFPEKLIPLMINNMLEGKPLPVYGDGRNVRDWLYVDDHNQALWRILRRGVIGETYNIGGENEWENITLVNRLCETAASATGHDPDYYKRLIHFVRDRPGHDRRYAIDSGKIRHALDWRPSYTFEQGLSRTVQWYLEHPDWVRQVKSGEYLQWIEKQYHDAPK